MRIKEPVQIMSAPILFIDNLKKQYGSTIALESISFNISANELLCIIGPSGSGKSTLLNIIAGTEKQTSGEIFLMGKALTELPPYKRDFGIVFQGLNLFPHLSVFDNIAFSLRTRRHKVDKKTIEERVRELIKIFQLEKLENRLPRQLSGGEKQRVAIARAIAFKPNILLLDEPFSALDKLLKEILINELKHLQMNLGLTIVYITHDQHEAASLSDKVLILNRGKIQQIGTYEEIYNNPANKFVRQFIGFNNMLRGTVVREQDNNLIVKLNNDINILVKKNTEARLGQNIELFIRPEDVFKVNELSNDLVNLFQVKVLRSIKSESGYRILFDFLPGETWYFYNASGGIAPNEKIIVYLDINKLTYYN